MNKFFNCHIFFHKWASKAKILIPASASRSSQGKKRIALLIRFLFIRIGLFRCALAGDYVPLAIANIAPPLSGAHQFQKPPLNLDCGHSHDPNDYIIFFL